MMELKLFHNAWFPEGQDTQSMTMHGDRGGNKILAHQPTFQGEKGYVDIRLNDVVQVDVYWG